LEVLPSEVTSMLLALSDDVWIAAIGVVGTIATGVVTVMLAWIAHRQTTQIKEAKEVKQDLQKQAVKLDSRLDDVSIRVDEIHKATNSMKDELVAKAGELGHAQGMAQRSAEMK
jgi:predicted RecB family endonuclease